MTRILAELRTGHPEAASRLYPLVFDELRGQAARLLRERDRIMWQPTQIVNDAFCKLVDASSVTPQDRKHFYSVAAIAMRRIVVDLARRELAQKRGGAMHRLSLDELADPGAGVSPDFLLDIDALLERLREDHERPARVVELKFFGGLPVAEIADLLAVSERTVAGDWEFARSWLFEHW